MWGGVDCLIGNSSGAKWVSGCIVEGESDGRWLDVVGR